MISNFISSISFGGLMLIVGSMIIQMFWGRRYSQRTVILYEYLSFKEKYLKLSLVYLVSGIFFISGIGFLLLDLNLQEQNSLQIRAIFQFLAISVPCLGLIVGMSLGLFYLFDIKANNLFNRTLSAGAFDSFFRQMPWPYLLLFWIASMALISIIISIIEKDIWVSIGLLGLAIGIGLSIGLIQLAFFSFIPSHEQMFRERKRLKQKNES